MHLDEGAYEPTLPKGDILHYYQGLINHLEKLITDSLHSVLLVNETKTSKTTTQDQEILSIGKDLD